MSMIRPEFSRRIPVQRIGATGIEQAIEASSAELKALAGRLQLPAIASFRCSFRLSPPIRGQVTAEGELRAEVTQLCVVSLEPFEATVAERFTLCFVPEGTELDEIDPALPDELIYSGDAIDIGEAASEQLALALDPYPRMPGVALPPVPEGEDPDAPGKPGRAGAGDAPSKPENPFAKLARLRSDPAPDEE